jgi:CubicO group peptidase (beta-lactamase class C family)
VFFTDPRKCLKLIFTRDRLSKSDHDQSILGGINEISEYGTNSVPDCGSVITIDHLLHHTSGLRDWVALVKISGRYMGDTITDDFLFRLISSQKELNFPPGEEFLYSNSGYFLLAQIVSRVTKTSFRNWCEENIFKPLEMNNTHFSDDHAEIIKGRADSYVQNEDGEYTNSSNLLTAFGSSSLYSTVDDMTKWVKNYDKKAVGGESAWEMMVKRGSLNDGQNVDYGFGLSIGDYKGIVQYQHGGSWAGYLCEIVYYPEKNLSHILIINRDPSGVYVSNELNAILFPEEKTEQKQTASKEGAGEDKVEISPEILEQYVGVFYSPKRKRIIEVERINDRLVLHFPWKRNVEAVPLSQEVFHIDEYGWEFSFASDDTGFVDQLRIHTGNGYSPYDRIYTDISSWEDSIDLTGEYYSKELQTTYTIVKRRSSLIAEHMQNEDVLLARVDKNHYVGDKWWFEGMKVIRKADDSVAGFRMSADNDAVRGVLFEKK